MTRFHRLAELVFFLYYEEKYVFIENSEQTMSFHSWLIVLGGAPHVWLAKLLF